MRMSDNFFIVLIYAIFKWSKLKDFVNCIVYLAFLIESVKWNWKKSKSHKFQVEISTF